MHSMTIEDVVDLIVKNCEGVNTDSAWGATFFSCDPERKYPFATIVTSDNDYDSYSNLNREGVYRLNVGIEKDEFRQMFAEDAEHDFTALDTVMPNPVYGKNSWICVVNPSLETFEKLKPYIDSAYMRALQKEGERQARR